MKQKILLKCGTIRPMNNLNRLHLTNDNTYFIVTSNKWKFKTKELHEVIQFFEWNTNTNVCSFQN